MKIAIPEAIAMLAACDEILLLTHRSPDGDTVGAASALCMALRQLGKTAYLVADPDMTPKLRPFSEQFFAPEQFEPRFVCAIDCASSEQVCAAGRKYAERVDLCIDHHPSNTLFSSATLLDADAAASAELVHEVICALGIPLTRELALPLYLGLATDSGCFRYADVTPRTLRYAAEMLATGIDFYSLNRKFFEEKSRGRLALEQRIFDHAEYHGDAVFGCYTLADIAETGADEDDRNNLASVLMQVEDIKLALLLRESASGEWKLSARSVPGVDACSVCANFGGGGHITAAGATLNGNFDDIREKILAAAKREIDLRGLKWA